MKALDAIQEIVAEIGIESWRERDQLYVRADDGENQITFRIYQSGYVLVLLGLFPVAAPPERYDAMVEFANRTNFGALVVGNLEVNPDDGFVQLRVFLLLADNRPPRLQLRWFVTVALGTAATLAPGIAKVAMMNADPFLAATEVQMAMLSRVATA